MGYVKDSLMPNEKVLFTARVHPAVFLPSILTFVMTIAFFVYSSKVMMVSKAGSPPSQTSAVNGEGILLLCFSGFLFLYSIWLGLQALIVVLTTEFAVTNHRVIAKTGFIRRHTLEMLLPKIESISVNQNILGRLLNFGTVTVTGTGGTKESFRAIVDPIGVRKKINQIIEGYMRYQQQLSNQQAGG